MKKTILILTAIIATGACSNIKLIRENETKPKEGNLEALKTGKEIVKINDTTLHEGYLDFLSRINPRVKGQIKNPATRKKIIDNLVEQELLYQESVKRGLDKKDDIINKAALYNKVVISQALLEEELEKKSREYFEKNKETQFTKVSFSQILLNFKKPEEVKKEEADKEATDKKEEDKKKAKKEEEPVTPEEKEAALKQAQDLKGRVAGGEDFAKVAEEASDDKGSKKKGGDMGAISRDDKRMARLGLEAVTTTVFSMKKGDISEPIETKKGYVIIKVTSDPQVTPFEEADRIIRLQIQQEVKDTLLSDLKKSAKITLAQEEKVEPSPTEPTEGPPPGVEPPKGKTDLGASPKGDSPNPFVDEPSPSPTPSKDDHP